jgi:tetratricopeptide (TPR) repeat protein
MELSAQNLPERRLVRKGNEQFNSGNYRSSVDYYDKALAEVPGGYAPTYNKANAYLNYLIQNPTDTLYNWEMSNTLYEDIANDILRSDEQRAEAYRNIGESLMLQQNHEAALNAFRESLKLNPDDDATKYNYILAKRIVDQKRNQQQQQQNQQKGRAEIFHRGPPEVILVLLYNILLYKSI